MSTAIPPSSPRWQPTTEADLQAAINSGLIEEGHFFDAKRESSNTKGANKELGRDLASFAIDGGTIVYGIAEDKENSRFELAPQPLAGLAEKVEQVARTRIDPPLPVVSRLITTESDPSTGYLVIHVPVSPQAPHMSDDRYWGRGDKTKHPLSDGDVFRLHQRRRSAEADALELLRLEIANDPMADVGDQSHLFIVAQPLAGADDMLLDLTSAPDWNTRLWDFMMRAYTPELNKLLHEDPPPSLRHAGSGYRRAGGAAKATPNIGQGREYTGEGEDAIELQVLENGGLRIYFSRLSDGPHGEHGQILIDVATVTLTRRMIALTLAAAEEFGYRGAWALAVGATKLRNRRTLHAFRGFRSETERYSADTYEQATGASWAELRTTPGAITRRLVGPFLRALNRERDNEAALTDTNEAVDTDVS